MWYPIIREIQTSTTVIEKVDAKENCKRSMRGKYVELWAVQCRVVLHFLATVPVGFIWAQPLNQLGLSNWNIYFIKTTKSVIKMYFHTIFSDEMNTTLKAQVVLMDIDMIFGNNRWERVPPRKNLNCTYIGILRSSLAFFLASKKKKNLET